MIMEDKAPSTSRTGPLIKAAVFSSWSHTMGPQMVHLWVPNHDALPKKNRSPEEAPPSLDTASRCQTKRVKAGRKRFERDAEDLTSQLLHGELHGDSTPCSRSKVFVLPGKGLVLHSRVFRINGRAEGGAPLALTVVYGYEELERMWNYYGIVELAISRTVAQMKKNHKADVGRIISDAMDRFLVTLTKLQLNNGSKAKVEGKEIPSLSEGERPFQEKMLVSHLQTSGSTLILSDSEADANKMMHFLLPFLSSEDRQTSFSILPDKKWSYCPGIMVQALIKDKFGQADVWVRHMVQNPYPSTIVDTGNKKVRQLMNSSATSQCTWRHEAEGGDGAHQASENFQTTNSLYTKKCNLKSVSHSGLLVPEFLKELDLLDQHQKEAYSRLFARHLSIKGAAAVRIADHLRHSQSGIQTGDLKSHLGLTETPDLKVILGSAQKFHPDATSWIGKN